MSAIHVHRCRVHNLQQVDVTIPHNSLAVITGVSGSGKSSLAFQTLYAEGQRRFLKTLSAQAPGWLELLPRPDVDAIEGLPPVIAVRQERIRPNARSTVANVTEILDYLRVLYTRLGVVHCPDCHLAVEAQSPEQILQRILQYPPGTKLMLLAPVVRQQTGSQQELIQRSLKEGYVRGRIDGEIVELHESLTLDPRKRHTIEVVIDRLIIKEEIQSRLAESLEHTLRVGAGSCLVTVMSDGVWQDQLFHRDLCCPGCGVSFPPLEPSTFSWSTAQGACPACAGTGVLAEETTADSPWKSGKSAARKIRETGGTGKTEKAGEAGKTAAKTRSTKPPQKQTVDAGEAAGEEAAFLARPCCPVCQGERLNPLAAQTQLAQVRLPELLRWPVPETANWLRQLPDNFPHSDQKLLLQKLTEPLLYRLQFLEAVGVGYLSLHRTTATLSAGELQRVRLARCLGTQLLGSCYILDEPTSGLHAADALRLIDILKQITASGNTVVCVEHNMQVIAAADYLIELGPQGGKQGGQVLFQGVPEQLRFTAETPTAQAWQQALTLPMWESSVAGAAPRKQAARTNSQSLTEPFLQLRQASLHNLKNVQVQIPLNQLTCVTGVSGSGKSTLIMESLVPLIQQTIKTQCLQAEQLPLGELTLTQAVTQVEVVDQLPPGKQSRSCLATYSGMWQIVRKILARTRLSRVRGYTHQRFSLNSLEGACPKCRGRGEIRLKEQLLSENRVVCPVCRGARFNPATLDVRYQGKSLAELLQMTVDEALVFWADVAPVQQKLQSFQEIGLGYLSLGQSARSLSGGEAQRMKLARKLAIPFTGSLLILDEPTCGLHWQDTSRLVNILQQLVRKGNTLIVIEHHPLMQAAANWQVELGPAAGQAGGEILYAGVGSEDGNLS